MKTYSDGRLYIVVLKKGEELFESLPKFAEEHGINSAWFQAFGAAKEVELGYYKLDEQKYAWQKFNGPLEITGLQGNIAQKDGQPIFHAHGSFSNQDFETFGGHVKRMVVAGTCEIFLQPLKIQLTREHDPEVGLDLLSEF